MDILNNFLDNFIELSLEAAPWLLFGLLAAGLIKVWIPESFMKRVLGGRGVWPVIKAALVGAPLPLCSCGVLPAAIGLRRAGASRGATLSFLIATPETGVDSIGISYVLLGPFMTAVRVIAAIASAIVAGLLAVIVLDRARVPDASPDLDNGDARADAPCCSPAPIVEVSGESCNSGGGCSSNSSKIVGRNQTFWQRNIIGLKYAMSDVWDDISYWLLFGLVLAGLLSTFVPDQALAEWGSGLPAMILMLLVGIPMYICATASTPLAAGLLLAGISPGTILVLLLAGPATNLATIAILLKEMGRMIVAVYLVGIAVTSIAFGLLTDFVVTAGGIDINAQIEGATDIMPEWLAIISVVLLLASSIKPLRKRVIGC